MLKSSKLLVVIAALALCGAAMAQVPGAGDPVPLDIVGPPVGGEQGTTEVGDPPAGAYDVLINGYIGAYARVSAYDNWINFGVMLPTDGTYDAPAIRYAYTEASGLLLAGEVGSLQPNLGAFTNAGTDFSSHDCAGIQIQTNARLDLSIDFGGYMTRVDENGVLWDGADNRRIDQGYYELRNQMKMAFRGRFLNFVDATDPAADEDGVQYISNTSRETTDFGNWTQWGETANTIALAADGWFEPTTGNDPWRGDGVRPAGTDMYRDPAAFPLDALDLVVERGQAQESAATMPVAGDAAAAEVLFASRILRRGLQDIQGNYRGQMWIELAYREGDVDTQWNPGVK